MRKRNAVFPFQRRVDDRYRRTDCLDAAAIQGNFIRCDGALYHVQFFFQRPVSFDQFLILDRLRICRRTSPPSARVKAKAIVNCFLLFILIKTFLFYFFQNKKKPVDGFLTVNFIRLCIESKLDRWLHSCRVSFFKRSIIRLFSRYCNALDL